MAEPASAEDIAALLAEMAALHDCVHKQTEAVREETAGLAREVRKNRAASTRNHASMARRMNKQETSLLALAETVGQTDDHPGGATIVSRLKRAEGKIRAGDIVRDRIKTGAAVALPLTGFFLSVIWWLERAQISKLLGLP
jgi:hypothetical protein